MIEISEPVTVATDYLLALTFSWTADRFERRGRVPDDASSGRS